jgi:hypothetical protein
MQRLRLIRYLADAVAALQLLRAAHAEPFDPPRCCAQLAISPSQKMGIFALFGIRYLSTPSTGKSRREFLNKIYLNSANAQGVDQRHARCCLSITGQLFTTFRTEYRVFYAVFPGKSSQRA